MRFNDETYDGIVLKIPSFFIKMNNLDSILNTLKESLDECRLSMYLPDHQNNLYELENYNKKSEILNQRKESEKERKLASEKYMNNILEGRIKILEWSNIASCPEYDVVEINGRDFKWNDYLTNKLNVKTEFVKYFKANILTYEDFIEFIKINRFDCVSAVIQDSAEDLIDWRNCTFNSSQYNANLQINVNVIYCQTNIRKNKSSYKYNRTLLQYKNGNHCVNNEILDGYERQGMKLVLKKGYDETKNNLNQ